MFVVDFDWCFQRVEWFFVGMAVLAVLVIVPLASKKHSCRLICWAFASLIFFALVFFWDGRDAGSLSALKWSWTQEGKVPNHSQNKRDVHDQEARIETQLAPSPN